MDGFVKTQSMLIFHNHQIALSPHFLSMANSLTKSVKNVTLFNVTLFSRSTNKRSNTIKYKHLHRVI